MTKRPKYFSQSHRNDRIQSVRPGSFLLVSDCNVYCDMGFLDTFVMLVTVITVRNVVAARLCFHRRL